MYSLQLPLNLLLSLYCRLGFLNLFSHGKASLDYLDDAFIRLNSSPCGMIDLEAVWTWYWTTGNADIFPPEFSFANVVSVELRAASILYRRFVLK